MSTQNCTTLKPARLIEAERTLSSAQTETFEQWKARQAAISTDPTVITTAESVTTKATAILNRLKDLQSPALINPRSPVDRAMAGHVHFNNPRPSNGLRVRRELVSEKSWTEPERKVVDRPTAYELKGFRFTAPRALPEDWEDYTMVLDVETGKQVKVFKTRTQRLTKRANRLNLESPTVSMDTQEQLLERLKTQQLVQNLWVPKYPVLPVFPAAREMPAVEKRVEVAAAPCLGTPPFSLYRSN